MSEMTILSFQFQRKMKQVQRAVPWYWVVTENVASFMPSLRFSFAFANITAKLNIGKDAVLIDLEVGDIAHLSR